MKKKNKKHATSPVTLQLKIMPRIQQLIDHTDIQLAQEEELEQTLVRLLNLIDNHLLTENIELLQELKVEVTYVINLIKISKLYCTES